jgi:reactive intermediate/imine deaminase|tara:strand:- start:1187 stop:1624 length:438 start_codon:yes stop_codon:yes gene_type:complete
MMKILISLVISLITISVHADDVGYYTSKATIDNNYPFSDAVTVGDILYLSGIIGETNGELAEGGIIGETHQAMKNMQVILEQHDLDLSNIFKCLVMIDDISQWSLFNSAYIQYFNRPYPARSAFGADGLAMNATFEIECMAKIPR